MEFVRSADGDVYFKASRPATDGSLGAGPTTHGGTIQSHGLTLLAEPLEDDAWRDALRRIFVDFAERVGAVLATAEVIRGVRWSGRSIGYDGDTERTTCVARRGQRSGLPPYPVWWTWFGDEYAPPVHEHLPAHRVEKRGHALFHWRANAPLDRDRGPGGVLVAQAADLALGCVPC